MSVQINNKTCRELHDLVKISAPLAFKDGLPCVLQRNEFNSGLIFWLFPRSKELGLGFVVRTALSLNFNLYSDQRTRVTSEKPHNVNIVFLSCFWCYYKVASFLVSTPVSCNCVQYSSTTCCI